MLTYANIYMSCVYVYNSINIIIYIIYSIYTVPSSVCIYIFILCPSIGQNILMHLVEETLPLGSDLEKSCF